ncbi:MAG: hypothetical protein EPN22_06610 [Nitrospirae bacterium]|nr:MAG: hypothetical protein EPN22_06610 [Nitrospirota bacterium]
MKNKTIWTATISYAICFIALIVLIEATWGITSGLLVGNSMGTDKTTQAEVSRILKERGIKEPYSSNDDNENWYEKLPPDVKEEIQRVVKRKLQTLNWFGITIFISMLTFSTIGFLCGFLNRDFTFVGILVLLSFLVNNPVVRFPHAKALDLLQKALVVLAQFGACYLFGYFGVILRRKRDSKHLETDKRGCSIK